MKEFEEFGGKIKYYQLMKSSSKKINDRFEHQTYHNIVFHETTFPGTESRWRVLSDASSRRVTPLSYFNSYTGTQEEQCCGHAITYTYKDVLQNDGEADENLDVGKWFQVPTVCEKLL